MKLSLAVALPLALVAVAAPTPLKLKRDEGDSPSADVASKIAYGSLKVSSSFPFSREHFLILQVRCPDDGLVQCRRR